MRAIIDRLDEHRREQLGEVIRFGVVGVLATFIQYAVYWVLIRWLNPSVSMTIGYVVSFAFNFLASTRYTFRVKASARRGAGFALSHGVNYLLQMVTLNLFLWLGISKQWAPIPMFCVCVPVNFLLVRFFLKGKGAK
ncbi:MAG: GtrA family protein [Prevotella sp.]|nr:GtrA family protein [Prevotella sp.]